jgi:hypothetical protein
MRDGGAVRGRLLAFFPIPLQELFHGEAVPIRVVGVTAQPLFQVLFRTEEIIDASTASLEHDGLRGSGADELTMIDVEGDTLGAVGAGIVNDQFVRGVCAVDQQQEIHRSSDFELFLSVHLHLVGVEIDLVTGAARILGRDAVGGFLGGAFHGDGAEIEEESQRLLQGSGEGVEVLGNLRRRSCLSALQLVREDGPGNPFFLRGEGYGGDAVPGRGRIALATGFQGSGQLEPGRIGELPAGCLGCDAEACSPVLLGPVEPQILQQILLGGREGLAGTAFRRRHLG